MAEKPDPRIRELQALIEALEDEGVLDAETRSAIAALLGRSGGRKGGLTPRPETESGAPVRNRPAGCGGSLEEGPRIELATVACMLGQA